MDFISILYLIRSLKMFAGHIKMLGRSRMWATACTAHSLTHTHPQESTNWLQVKSMTIVSLSIIVNSVNYLLSCDKNKYKDPDITRRLD
jgi:hypothetical protein